MAMLLSVDSSKANIAGAVYLASLIIASRRLAATLSSARPVCSGFGSPTGFITSSPQSNLDPHATGRWTGQFTLASIFTVFSAVKGNGGGVGIGVGPRYAPAFETAVLFHEANLAVFRIIQTRDRRQERRKAEQCSSACGAGFHKKDRARDGTRRLVRLPTTPSGSAPN